MVGQTFLRRSRKSRSRGGSDRKNLRIRLCRAYVTSSMKKLFTLTLSVLALAAFATTTFAGSCGGCTGDSKKDKDKTEEGAQS